MPTYSYEKYSEEWKVQQRLNPQRRIVEQKIQLKLHTLSSFGVSLNKFRRVYTALSDINNIHNMLRKSKQAL